MVSYFYSIRLYNTQFQTNPPLESLICMLLNKKLNLSALITSCSSAMLKPVWALIGSIALLLGIFGVFLPVLPTTPFVLLSAWCFAKSSPRLHEWLVNSTMFGNLIKNWEQYQCISLKTKLWALFLMIAVGGASILFFVPAGWPTWLTLSLLLIGGATVLNIRTCPRG